MFTTLVLVEAHECTTTQIEGKELFFNLAKFEQVGPNTSRFSILVSDDSLNVLNSGCDESS